MGVQITEILTSRELRIEDLKGKVIIIDAPNHLYQFLTTIRGRDGTPFTNSKGNVTSHLIGLLSRTTNLMQKGIRLAYVFDGQVPKLKHLQLEERRKSKEAAEKKFTDAAKLGDPELMKKYAGRFSRLAPSMVSDAKKLLSCIGVPYLDAPSEAEAQAAYIVKRGDGYAVSSQDADCFLFGATKLIRNMSITGKRKRPGSLSYDNIVPQMLILDENLKNLKIDQEQLIALGMLVGTDYNTKGIKGIGPKKALDMVIKHGHNFEDLFLDAKWAEHFNQDWKEVMELFTKVKVTDDYELRWSGPKPEDAKKFLVDEQEFSQERVDKAIEMLSLTKPSQKGLGEFF